MDLAKMIDINFRYKFRYKLQKFFVSNLYLNLKEISETIENNEKSQKCPLPQDSGKNIDLDNK